MRAIADRYTGSHLRAFMPMPNTASQSSRWTRHRGGMRFGKEPVELTFEELGEDRAGRLKSLLAIAGDPALRVILVQSGGPTVVLNDGEGFPNKGAIDLIAADLAEAYRSAAPEGVNG